ncbi:MAG TPA: hypothetical protein PK970_04725 [Hyphomicrobiaceae bacterium]|nr:hypothetical protein [Hyphomicrobiaceae bacterium]
MTNETAENGGAKRTPSSWWNEHSDAVYTAIVITVVAGIGSTLWSMNSQLGSISAKIDYNEKRIERVAAAFPEIREKMAATNLATEFDIALIQIAPARTVGVQPTNSLYIDRQRGAVECWKLVAPADVWKIDALNGRFASGVEVKKSLYDLEVDWISKKSVPAMPRTVNTKKSFAGFGPSEDMRDAFKELNFELIGSKPLGSVETNYQKLSEIVKSNSDLCVAKSPEKR